jgi:uncharacterized protein YbaR (Trm112 family)/SAM-dependent methyltransferase
MMPLDAASSYARMPPDLRNLIACPACRASLGWDDRLIRCVDCGLVFPVRNGIPVLLVDPDAAAELEHRAPCTGSAAHKRHQADHFDSPSDAEFEITRPHGAPALYRWLLAQKFTRSVTGLAASLRGATVLVACGGSGMDAEFLARRGARVISSDLSLGAAERTRVRAERFGLDVWPIVADVERLPFRDRSVEVVYVHDGLHHLTDPYAGLLEMMRVARRALSVTEPCQAWLTQLAVSMRLALAREAAGNVVARLVPHRVAVELARGGFHLVTRERYLMYYPHVPGGAMRAVSRPPIFGLIRMAWRLGNSVWGRLGNKLVAVAVRTDDVSG